MTCDQNANNAKAEQVAGEYARAGRHTRLQGTHAVGGQPEEAASGELSKKSDVAVPAMQQILTPIRDVDDRHVGLVEDHRRRR